MKKLTFLLFAVAALSLNAEPPSDMAVTVRKLWLESKFDELSKFISNQEIANGDYASVIVLSAFRDYAYSSKVREADVKLSRISKVITASPEAFSDEFKSMLAEFRRDLSNYLEVAARLGVSQEAVKANASPATTRKSLTEQYNPPLDLLKITPNIKLTR